MGSSVYTHVDPFDKNHSIFIQADHMTHIIA